MVDESLSARRVARAEALGLIAMWSKVFGFVSVHDPTCGEWHDIGVADAEPWMLWEAHKRKELRKYNGVRKVHTASEMCSIWKEEQTEMWDEADPAVTKRGIVYEDYLENDEVGRDHDR